MPCVTTETAGPRARRRVLAVLALSALAVGLLSAPAASTEAPPAEDAVLTDLVTRHAHTRAATDPGAAAAPVWADTAVTVRRSQGRWRFGSVVLVAPRVGEAKPRDWVFLAERRAGGWYFGLDGEPAFAELAAAAPMLSAAERAVFADHGGGPSAAVNGDYRTGMRLPWALNQAWTLRGGPHAHDAGSGPWSSLDLVGGDQRVLAARAGVAYTQCVGLIRVLHPDGYTSRYYHLWDHLQVDGASVAEGAYLGLTGTEVGCGGSASSRHVHFSLLHNGAFIAIANHIIGKWLPRNGSAQYGGSALHGSTEVGVGGALLNYGVLGRTQGIVDANGGTVVNRRSGPGTGFAVVGTTADGATVGVACSATGTSHTGRWGTTARWDRLTDGTWVSGAYLYTGVTGPVNGTCP